MSLQTNVQKALVLAAVGFIAACAPTDSGPIGLDDLDFAVGDRDSEFNFDDFVGGVGKVCVFYPDPIGAYGQSTFSASATGGDVYAGTWEMSGPPYNPHCFEAWNATDASLVAFTGNLVSPADGLALDRIVTLVSTLGSFPEANTILGQTWATITLSDITGGMVWFKFTPFEEPPDGGQGCTPGYWRQSQHFDSWTDPYDPTDLFSSVFADAFPGQTLLDVVWARGGGLNALGRHAVAALLNAASPDVEYDYTVDEVIARFNAAYASGDNAQIEDQKDAFDFLNNQGCLLD